MEFFEGFFRTLGTKTGFLPLPPTLDVQSASVHANNSNSQKNTLQLPNPHTLQDTVDVPPQKLLVYPEQRVQPKKQKQCILRKLLRMATHHSLCTTNVEIPKSKGIHYVEQIQHSNTPAGTLLTEDQCPMLGANCHKGVVFQTMKSFVCAQNASLQITETTTNVTFLQIYLIILICRRWSYSLHPI